jgi:hypothetical protein
MKRSIKLSYLYSIVSVIIGPAIVLLSSSKHPSGFDCADLSWDGTGTPIVNRKALYDHAARFMIPAATIMIAIGALVLGYLIYDSIKNKRFKDTITPAFLILFMLFGYWLVIAIASSPWC